LPFLTPTHVVGVFNIAQKMAAASTCSVALRLALAGENRYAE
jgi:uncharacterized membrane protein YiaA